MALACLPAITLRDARGRTGGFTRDDESQPAGHGLERMLARDNQLADPRWWNFFHRGAGAPSRDGARGVWPRLLPPASIGGR
jgi:hypothetical protein